MGQTATKELLELDKLEGKPLDLLRKVLDTLGAQYETLQPTEGDRVIRVYNDIYLEPFLEPNSVLFAQKIGTYTLITAIEQLTKVDCISFRTQLNEDRKLLTASDLINNPGELGDRTTGRILINTKENSRNLHLLFESMPGNKIGQCSCSVTIPDCLKEESPINQILDIYLFYKGDSPFLRSLNGRISVWHWK